MNPWKLLLVALSIGRLFCPFLVFQYPLMTIVIIGFLDNADGYVCYRSGLSWKNYNTFDKVFDYWWYIFILIYSIPLDIFPIILIMFLVRSVGQFFAIKNHDTHYLLYFPNTLEIFFTLYIISIVFTPLHILFEGILVILPIILSIILALIQEYRIHIKKNYFALFFWKLNLNWDS